MIKRIKRGTVNCHLLTGKGGSILVDACNPSDADAIYKEIKDENVRLILLTHGHPDHFGAAAELARRLSVPVAMSRDDAVLLENYNARTLHTHTFLGRVLKLMTRILVPAEGIGSVCPDIWLEDGQDLSVYGVEAKVIALPGHTMGSVGVLTGTDFIVGDALFNLLRPTKALLFEDREAMERSVGVVARSRATLIHVGHGRPIPTINIS